MQIYGLLSYCTLTAKPEITNRVLDKVLNVFQFPVASFRIKM